MKIRYYGFPVPGTMTIVRYVDDERQRTKPRDLPMRRDLAQHAEAFEWGKLVVNGQETNAMPKGADALALAICAHALADDQRALALYQRFKRRVDRKSVV